MSKQQRHERKKTERVRRRAMRNGAAALAAAGAIAAGTSAYADPVRFDNLAHGEPGHFHWPHATGDPENFLDIAIPTTGQPASPTPTSVSQIIDVVEGSVRLGGPAGGGAQTSIGAPGFPDGFFLVGVGAGEPIPTSGTAWSSGANPIAYFSGFGTLLPTALETYLGFKFDLGSGDQYGWIGVVMDPTDHTLDPFAWGYETDPGVPIVAGVPEPGSLALLAIGAAGLSTRRRRRQLAN